MNEANVLGGHLALWRFSGMDWMGTFRLTFMGTRVLYLSILLELDRVLVVSSFVEWPLVRVLNQGLLLICT